MNPVFSVLIIALANAFVSYGPTLAGQIVQKLAFYMNTFNTFAVFSLLWSFAITAFWIYIALQTLAALRQIASTLRRIASTQEEITRK